MPHPHPHDIPKEIAFGNPKFPNAISFFAKHGGKRAASAFSTGDWGHTAQAAQKKFVNSFNSLLRRLRPTIKFVVFRPIT